MRQLLTWCGTRALGEKSLCSSEDSSSQLAGMAHLTPGSRGFLILTLKSSRDRAAIAERLLDQVGAV